MIIGRLCIDGVVKVTFNAIWPVSLSVALFMKIFWMATNK